MRCCRKARFSSGLIIDRTRNNTLSVCQQAFIMNKHGTKIELWDNLMDLFRKKKDAGKADDTKDKSKKKA